jgi:hypothetical protein
MTSRQRIQLLIVGLVGHAPGLWLLFRRSLPASARRENLVAALATLIALLVAWMLGVYGWWLVGIWLVGHFTWGARVVWLLQREEV